MYIQSGHMASVGGFGWEASTGNGEKKSEGTSSSGAWHGTRAKTTACRSGGIACSWSHLFLRSYQGCTICTYLGRSEDKSPMIRFASMEMI